MCSHVPDLIDKRSDLQGEIHQLEQELKKTKEELAQLEARKKEFKASGLSLMLTGSSSVSGLSKGASAGPSTSKKKRKSKQKTPLPALTRETGVL